MGKCDHASATNPRLAGTCVKCGRKRLPTVGPPKGFTPDLASDYNVYDHANPHTQDPDSETDPARDLGFESRFLADAVELAQRLHGIANLAYPQRVNDRLAIGRARYGDGAFLGKDNITEVLEETPDLAAYAMLELQRIRSLGHFDKYSEVRLDLVAVAAYGSIADWYAIRAGARLRGEEV